VATPQAAAAAEDTPIAISLTGSDVDGDALTFQIGRSPAHGTLSVLTGATLTYTPARDYHGPDSFTFFASDGRGAVSAPATVDLDVASVDDPPVALSFAHTFNEDTPNQTTLFGADIDSGALSYAIASQPAHGVQRQPAGRDLHAESRLNGDDSFTHRYGRHGDVDARHRDLHVTPVNDPLVDQRHGDHR
jgi:hypothetical protein